jgi:ligand-binding SRPBCC domain-containing protein
MPTVRFVEQYPLSRPVLFAFFQRPANVVRVAPPELKLHLVEGPDLVTPGARFTVEMRRWGLPQRIETEVVEVEEPVRLVEEQRHGPFRQWRVSRILTEQDEQTELVEMIDYEPPGGLLGFVVTRAAIERELEQAYAGRVERVLAALGVRPA